MLQRRTFLNIAAASAVGGALAPAAAEARAACLPDMKTLKTRPANKIGA